MKVSAIAIVALMLFAVSCTHIQKSHLTVHEVIYDIDRPIFVDATIPFKGQTSAAPYSYPPFITKGTRPPHKEESKSKKPKSAVAPPDRPTRRTSRAK